MDTNTVFSENSYGFEIWKHEPTGVYSLMIDNTDNADDFDCFRIGDLNNLKVLAAFLMNACRKAAIVT